MMQASSTPRAEASVPRRAFSPSLYDWLQFLALGPRDWFLQLVCWRYVTFLWSFYLVSPRFMAWSSGIRARRAMFRAAREVPAYADYLVKCGATPRDPPEMDKASYIQKYSTEGRCRAGRFPFARTMIDESSGSTGTPYNWIRTRRERLESQRFISYFANYCFGTKPWITINAFSMGSWATGLNMGQAMEQNGIVKNTGPDLGKIISTLRLFGPAYPYLILGYPPFLKHLLDVATIRGFPFAEYRLNALVGGEGMSEGLRDYLLRRFEKVYSGYGATDLEIGIAGETPSSVAIRRLAWKNPALKESLFGRDSRLPMVFQYNPLMHHVTVNAHRELVLTITRRSLLSSRIRYNVHDEGGVARYDQMMSRIHAAGCASEQLVGPQDPRPIRMPFLWVYGRRDSTISVMGANIYPEDLEQCLYADPGLARLTRSFCLSLSEGPSASVRPCFMFEVETEPTAALAERFARLITTQLEQLNADFREARREYPETLEPEIKLFRPGDGPFQADAGRIKQTRLLVPKRP